MSGEKNSKYLPEYDERAYQLCLLGATDKFLADCFGVTEQTINNWKKDHPSFFESLKKGKEVADSKVAEALFQRATGYEHDADDIKVVEGAIVITPTIKRYPPDPTSMIFWLKNRQPKLWREKPEDESASGDGNIQKVQIEVISADKGNSD
ncbi:MAG: terminase [Citrobacter portucalensis]|nr:terminase [Citrobacter portucalensis]